MSDYTGPTTTLKPLTASDIKAMMALMDDCERRWPKSERCVRLCLSPRMHVYMDMTIPTVKVAPTPFASLYGLPCSVEYGLPDGSMREYMADGSSVLTYNGGRRVRCLPNQRGET